MCTNCSFTQSPSGILARELITMRDEDFAEKRNEKDCCTLFMKGVMTVGMSMMLGALFITNVIEALARLFFAAVTLPFACCDDGVNFYKKISVQGVINAFNSLSLIAYAFFANFYEDSLSKQDGITLFQGEFIKITMGGSK